MSQPTNKSFASLKMQLIVIFSGVALFFFAMAVFRTDQLLFSDRLGWIENQSRLQVSGLNQNLRNTLYRQRQILAWNAQELINKNPVQWNQLEDVHSLAIGHMNKNNLVVDQFSHRDSKQGSLVANWQALQVERALGRVDFSEGQDVFVKPAIIQKESFVFVAYKIQDRILVALVDNSDWQASLDAQKQGGSQLALWTRGGLTVANSVAEYFSQQVEDDPVFTEIQKSENNHGLGVYRVSKTSQVFAYYEHIDGTNLYAVSSMPLKDLSRGRWAIIMQIGFLGLGLILLCVAGVLLVLKPFEKNYERLRQEIRNENLRLATQGITKDALTPISTNGGPTADEKLLHSERMQAYTKISSALGHELSGSVSAILGFAQRLRGSDSSVGESIQKEARHIHQVMERLLNFSGEKIAEKENLIINGPLQNAVKMIEPVLSYQGIQLDIDLKAQSERPVNYQALTKAFDCLLRNSIEAVDRCPTKRISVRSWDEGGSSFVEIVDTGGGIPFEVQDKIFDPFFSTKNANQHIGLGLATAYGIFKDHGADIEVVSPLKANDGSMVSGTMVRLQFRASVDADAPSAPMSAKIQHLEKELDDATLEATHIGVPLKTHAPASIPSAPSAMPSAPKVPPPPAAPTIDEDGAQPLSSLSFDSLMTPSAKSESSSRSEEATMIKSSEDLTRLNIPAAPAPKEEQADATRFELNNEAPEDKTEFVLNQDSGGDQEIEALLELPKADDVPDGRLSQLQVDMLTERLHEVAKSGIAEAAAASPAPVSDPSEFSKTDISIATDIREVPANLPEKLSGMKKMEFIDTPKKSVTKKSRGLDDFQVEIRRASKRPEE